MSVYHVYLYRERGKLRLGREQVGADPAAGLAQSLRINRSLEVLDFDAVGPELPIV